MSLVLFIFGMISLAFYIPEKLRGYTVRAVLMKSVVSLLFVAVAVSARSTAVLAPFIILGLVFGLLGDIWLDLKYVFPSYDSIFTYAGFSVFGIGHVLYCTGLLFQYGAGRYLICSFVLAAATAGAVLLMEKMMKLSYGKMKPVVLIYSFLLFSTVFIAGGLLYVKREPALWFIFIGIAFFAISDLILSGTYFGDGKKRPMDIISNYLFYYIGQFLIAYGLAFVK